MERTKGRFFYLAEHTAAPVDEISLRQSIGRRHSVEFREHLCAGKREFYQVILRFCLLRRS